MSAKQISTEGIEGIELQPLAQFACELTDLVDGLSGWQVTTATEQQLGPVAAVAVQVGDTRYLLRTHTHALDSVTELHTPDPGDPVQQLRLLLIDQGWLAQHLQQWWDGAAWRDAPLPSAA